MCRRKKNLIGSISDTFCRTTTLFSKFFECTCAVIGFRVYQKFWTPEKRQLLNCFHESRNVFDNFSIKVCERNSEKPVEYFPPETSRVSKFIIERGTTVDLELTSDHYRWSPLVQGGVEIKCKVTVKVLSATRRLVTERYRALVEELYVEPKEEETCFSIHQGSQGQRNSLQSFTRYLRHTLVFM